MFVNVLLNTIHSTYQSTYHPGRHLNPPSTQTRSPSRYRLTPPTNTKRLLYSMLPLVVVLVVALGHLVLALAQRSRQRIGKPAPAASGATAGRRCHRLAPRLRQQHVGPLQLRLVGLFQRANAPSAPDQRQQRVAPAVHLGERRGRAGVAADRRHRRGRGRGAARAGRG